MTIPAVRSPWSIVIPIKPVAVAKSRLTGISTEQRRDLAMAFALDTTVASLASTHVRRVVVVTNDPQRQVFSDMGAEVLDDRPDAGLNAAIVHGAHDVRSRDAGSGVIALAGDLPALRPGDLARALRDASSPYWFVADAAGVGTTLLAAAVGQQLSPAFGVHSRAAHLGQGAAEIASTGIERLRRDVDTTLDLADALRLGVGVHTAEVVAGLQHGALR